MIASSPKPDIAVARNDLKAPVYAGYRQLEDIKNDFTNNSLDFLFEKQVRKQATRHNNRLHEKSPRALIEIGDLHFNSGSFVRALKIYIKALSLDSDNVLLIQKIINSLLASGRLAESETFYRQLLELVDYHPRYLNQYLVFKVTESLNNPESIDDTRKTIRKYSDSNSDAILNTVGLFYILIEKDVLKASEYFNAALEINSENIDANNNLGVSLRNQGDFERAEKLLQKAHYLNLKYPSAYENLAGMYYMQKDLRRAISILENAIENDVDLSSEWQHNLAMFYLRFRQYKAAIAKYKDLQTREPSNNLITNNIGAAYESWSKIDKAELYYLKSVKIVRENAKRKQELDPRGALSFINIARVLYKTRRQEEALKFTKDAHKYFPRNHVVYHLESIIYGRSGDFEMARDRLRHALSIEPNHLDSIIDYSYVLEDIDMDYPAAVELLEPLINNSDYEDNDTVNNNLAFAYLKTGQIAKAEKLMPKLDDSFAALATRGFYYIQMDNLAMADKMYAKALKAAEEKNKARVNQFYYFELMEYWKSKKNIAKAISYAKKSLDYKANSTLHSLASDFLESQK